MPELQGRLSIGIHDLPIGRPKHDANRLGGSMDCSSGGAVVGERLIVGVLFEDRPPAENRAAAVLATSLVDRASQQLDDALPVGGRVELCPAGKWREHDVLGRAEVGRRAVFPAAPSLVLGDPIEPGALEPCTVAERSSAVQTGPRCGRSTRPSLTLLPRR